MANFSVTPRMFRISYIYARVMQVFISAIYAREYSNWYPRSSFIVEVTANFDLTQIGNNFKCATHISVRNGVRQAVIYNVIVAIN